MYNSKYNFLSTSLHRVIIGFCIDQNMLVFVGVIYWRNSDVYCSTILVVVAKYLNSHSVCIKI